MQRTQFAAGRNGCRGDQDRNSKILIYASILCWRCAGNGPACYTSLAHRSNSGTRPCKCGQSYLVSTNQWSISHERMNPSVVLQSCGQHCRDWVQQVSATSRRNQIVCFPPYIFTPTMQDLVSVRWRRGSNHRAERVTLGWTPVRRHPFPEKNDVAWIWMANGQAVSSRQQIRLVKKPWNWWSVRSIWGARDRRRRKKHWNKLAVQIYTNLAATLRYIGLIAEKTYHQGQQLSCLRFWVAFALQHLDVSGFVMKAICNSLLDLIRRHSWINCNHNHILQVGG